MKYIFAGKEVSHYIVLQKYLNSHLRGEHTEGQGPIGMHCDAPKWVFKRHHRLALAA